MRFLNQSVFVCIAMSITGCGDETTALYPACPPGPVKTGGVCTLEEPPLAEVPTEVPTIEPVMITANEPQVVTVLADDVPLPADECLLVQTAKDAPQGHSRPSLGQLAGKWATTNICATPINIIITAVDLQAESTWTCRRPCQEYLNLIYQNTAWGIWDYEHRTGEAQGYNGWADLEYGYVITLLPKQTKIIVFYADTEDATTGHKFRVNLRNVKFRRGDEQSTRILPARRSDWRELNYR